MFKFRVGSRDTDLSTFTKLDSNCPVRLIDIIWMLHNPNEFSVITFSKDDHVLRIVKGRYDINQLVDWAMDNIYNVNSITITHRSGSDGGVTLLLDPDTSKWNLSIIPTAQERKILRRVDQIVSKYAKSLYLSFKYASSLDSEGILTFYLPFKVN